MHRGSGEVQVPWKTYGPVIQQLVSSPAKYQEFKSGMGEAWGDTSEGDYGADIIGNILPRGSAGITLVWSGGMGSRGDNYKAVRGSLCEFLDSDHT